MGRGDGYQKHQQPKKYPVTRREENVKVENRAYALKIN